MKKLSIVVVVVLVALIFSADAFARGGERGEMGGGGHRGKWWKDAEVVKTLNLTEKQVEGINKISSDERRGQIKVRSDLEILRIDMDDAMEAKELDSGKVNKLIDKYASLKAQHAKGRMKSLLEIRKLLTQEQYLKLKAMRPERGGKKGAKRQDKGGKEKGRGK
ncbi:MAG: periplasmic heavy metal sensor [Deltaproteobacteria bacterium]|jgi:periplasmic protein CpxP/Spy|nr:periplasmic heavy metal sensor [Deltaproteobacteria bacterium]